jgi:hypothetical protein
MMELGWKDAIVKVLSQHGNPMHYIDITQAIAENGLKSKFGATPAASVAAAISLSLQKDGVKSPFVKVSRGIYTIKPLGGTSAAKPQATSPDEQKDETGFVNAFGMYWQRDNVLWAAKPRLLGQQQLGSPVDFCQQKGVYLLHDGSKVVYVGRTTDQPLGLRLKQHTSDRLNGRWDRFSWFGIFAVSDKGNLSATPPDTFNIENLIATMEALLIEGLEPPQNRKRGDDFSAAEFLQVKDPEIQKSETLELIEKLKGTLSS